jgi:IS605 OrfB family transposase
VKTTPLNIKECSDSEFIFWKQVNYSYAFRKLHSNIDKISDITFQKQIQKQFSLTDIEFRSLVSEVKTKIEQTKTNKQNQEERIMSLIQDIEKLKNNPNPKTSKNNITRTIFKKSKKIKEIENSLQRDITFGSKKVLRDLTKLHNNIKVIENDKEKTPEEKQKSLIDTQLKIEETKKLFSEKRILHSYNLGEANQIGNRFFKFDFKNQTIIYKPYLGKKITIKYSCGKKQQKELLKLQELINVKEIAITVQLSTEQICLSFDNEILSGFYVDEKERRKEVKSVSENSEYTKEQKDTIIKYIYSRYREDLKQKKLSDKISTRYVAIDTNPEYIGYCIADKGENGIEKIIEKGVIDFRGLHEKLNLASDDKLKVKQNNKCKFEIHNSWKTFFNSIKHYKCAYFVNEDIENIGKNEAKHSTEANRKIKNIWHRKISDWQIEKRCIENGIELIKINPCYTSFIGNLSYDYFDATNASLEICRRGMFKYEKGLFYPKITGTISDTMSKFLVQQKIELKPRDVQIFKDCKDWVSLYKIASDNGLRWRWGWDDLKKSYSTFSMNNIKSKVKFVKFIN